MAAGQPQSTICLDSGVRSRVDTGGMSSCCASPAVVSPTKPIRCPHCDTRGSAVEGLAVKASLTESALGAVNAGPYRFCAEPSCAVVYFSDGGQLFDTTALRVPVWQKQPAGARTICYCFGENEVSMAREFKETGRCDASLRVRDHIAAGRCACEVRNPRGVCCLGDVLKAVARVEAQFAATVEE